MNPDHLDLARLRKTYKYDINSILTEFMYQSLLFSSHNKETDLNNGVC